MDVFLMIKRKTKKMKILKIAFAVFFIYTIISFVVIQVDITNRRNVLKQAQDELNEKQFINEEITNILNSGENTEYIMRIARDKLGLAFPNERVIIDYKRK